MSIIQQTGLLCPNKASLFLLQLTKQDSSTSEEEDDGILIEIVRKLTHVTVWLIESEVIGGWSYPISKHNDVDGAPFSLDGKTAEEIKGDYPNWLEEWTNKYGN
jgi:hypothetical protein